MSAEANTVTLTPRERVLSATEPPVHDINLEGIPEGLTRETRWVCWEWKWNGKKWDKLPMQPNCRPGSTADVSTWSDFPTVVDAAGRHGFGLGFVFSGDGLIGIDIDDCRDPESGTLQPWAREIVELLNTYGEVSPSGTGVKLFVRGELPDGFRKQHPRPDGFGAVEIFCTGRYFTVTGQRLPRTPDDIQDRSREVLQLYEMVSALKSEVRSVKSEKGERGSNDTAVGVPADCEAPTHRVGLRGAGGWDDRSTALAALEVLDPDMPYSDWLSVGMALHAVDPSDSMLKEFDWWSSRSVKHIAGEPSRKWKSFGGSGVGLGTLCHLANQTGRDWRPARRMATPGRLEQTSSLGDGQECPSYDQLVAERSKSGGEMNSGYIGYAFDKTGTREGWTKPMPLGGDPVAACPVETIPYPAGDYLRRLAEATQTPVDLAVGQFLVACAIALQKKFEVEPSPGWIEPLSLYLLAGMDPAIRKSAVVAAIAKPLRRYEADLAVRLAPMIRASRSAHEVRLKQRTRLMDAAAAETPGPDHDHLIHELEQLDEEIATHPPLADPSLLADDITSEHLATKMVQNQGRMGVLSPEGDLFDIMAGRYSKGPNIGIFLKGHCGDEVRVDRGNRPSEFIERPALSMGFCVQPEVLRGLQQQKTFRGKGLLGRLLYQMPESLLGRRKTSPREMDTGLEAVYDELMWSLLELPVPRRQNGDYVPRILHLNRPADEEFRAFREFVEDGLAEFGILSTIKDWGGKLPGAVARIAGLLHLVEHIREPELPLLIELHTIQNAITLGHYFITHAVSAFQTLGRSDCLVVAELILRTIERQELSVFSKRDIYQRVRRHIEQASDLDAPLEKLEEHGFIREVDSGSEGRGRRSNVFEVNPLYANRNS